MTDFMMRVDCFEFDGALKVNDIESFEANNYLFQVSKRRLEGEGREVWIDHTCNAYEFLNLTGLKKFLAFSSNLIKRILRYRIFCIYCGESEYFILYILPMNL